MMVVGLVWSNESRSYVGGIVATGRASHARLVRGEDPDCEAIQSVLQDCWGLDVRLTVCSGKNFVAKSKEAMAGLSEIRQPMKRFKDLRTGSWNVLRNAARNRDSWQKLLKKDLVQKGQLYQ